MTDGRNSNRGDRHGKQYADIGTRIMDKNTYQHPTFKPKIYRIAPGLWVIQYKLPNGGKLEVVECHSTWMDCVLSFQVELEMGNALRHVEGMGY